MVPDLVLLRGDFSSIIQSAIVSGFFVFQCHCCNKNFVLLQGFLPVCYYVFHELSYFPGSDECYFIWFTQCFILLNLIYLYFYLCILGHFNTILSCLSVRGGFVPKYCVSNKSQNNVRHHYFFIWNVFYVLSVSTSGL